MIRRERKEKAGEGAAEGKGESECKSRGDKRQREGVQGIVKFKFFRTKLRA